MPIIDWSDPDGEGEQRKAAKYRAGDTVHALVKGCKEKRAKSGALYFELRFVDDEGDHICYDNLMLEGDGRPYGLGKLKKLGFDENKGEILEAEVTGKRVWLSLHEESFRGEMKLKVAFKFTPEGWSGGYWRDSDGDPSLPQRLQEDAPAEKLPDDMYAIAEEVADEDVPF